MAKPNKYLSGGLRNEHQQQHRPAAGEACKFYLKTFPLDLMNFSIFFSPLIRWLEQRLRKLAEDNAKPWSFIESSNVKGEVSQYLFFRLNTQMYVSVKNKKTI